MLRKDNALYKLKNRSHLTVDLLIRYNHLDDKCYLFTIGTPKEVITTVPFNNNVSKSLFGYCLIEKINSNSAYILADFPYKNSTYTIDLDDPLKYDNKVVEMLLTEDGKWEPVKIRYDKEYPNGYRVVLSIYGLMLDSMHQTTSHQTSVMHIERLQLLKKLIPTISNGLKLYSLSSSSDILDIFNNYYNNIDQLYIVSDESSQVTETLMKLSNLRYFYNHEVKGLVFMDFQTAYNDLLNVSDRCYKNTLNCIIIDDLFRYAPSYIDLFALRTFLKTVLSIDGTVLMYIDLRNNCELQRVTKDNTMKRMIGTYVGTKQNASHIVALNKDKYYIDLPEGSIYDEFDINEFVSLVSDVRKELNDPVKRYDNYIAVLRKVFNVTYTDIYPEYIVLSLTLIDDVV